MERINEIIKELKEMSTIEVIYNTELMVELLILAEQEEINSFELLKENNLI